MMKQKENKIVIYQTKTGAIELRGDVGKETIWATQAQIADIFSVERSVVTKHIRNILNDKELNEKSVCANFAHTAADGKIYQVQFYSLDVILAVGYRANSARAIEFRQWATKTLHGYIVDGYVINKSRIAKNYAQFLEAIENIKHLLPAGTNIDHTSVLELISAFADTWVSLAAYDEDNLAATGATKRAVVVTANQLVEALGAFKQELIKKSEASELFGVERHKESVAGIVGNVMQ
ncbi:MAG: virulence RhuM family protein, partial [Candidatus Harrisonbacteria bacterium]|nr:virulence RhuM family protein [Candidatus Harrisonbacteria bacterium]